MKAPPFRVELLTADHDRRGFRSGVDRLDGYFQNQVTQDVRRRVTACFVAVDGAGCVASFYTLASGSVLLSELPAPIAKKLPRYPTVPVVRMGRLAVDTKYKGQGLGGAMLADALSRAARAEIGAFALMVDAKDDAAASFYRHHGLMTLPNNALTLFLPLSSVAGMT